MGLDVLLLLSVSRWLTTHPLCVPFTAWLAQDGRVYVISAAGRVEGEILVEGTEISGLVIDEGHLYITERSTGTIYKVAL